MDIVGLHQNYSLSKFTMSLNKCWLIELFAIPTTCMQMMASTCILLLAFTIEEE